MSRPSTNKEGRVLKSLLIAGLLMSNASTALAERPKLLKGTASVIDGDTIEIHKQRIRLHGIDAPESRQPCWRDGKEWRCGPSAANALARKIGRASVTCEVKNYDRYKRAVARCLKGDTDLGEWMVERGHAVAYPQYSKAYLPAEARARRAERGLWTGEFELPWEWRKAKNKKR